MVKLQRNVDIDPDPNVDLCWMTVAPLNPNLVSRAQIYAQVEPRLELGINSIAGAAAITPTLAKYLVSAPEISTRDVVGRINGCVDVNAGLNTYANAYASFFGLFDKFTMLLRTIEKSSRSLRVLIEKEETRSRDAHTDDDDSAARLADTLGLPFHKDLRIVQEASILRVVSERLSRLVTAPRHLVLEAAGAYLTTTALEVTLKHDIATRIHTRSIVENREGVDINTLSKECELDSDILGRTLRHLSVRGIFQEIEQGVFSNTEASSTLVNNPDFIAHLNVWIQDIGKGAPYYEEHMRRRFKAAKAEVSTPAPFTMYTGGIPYYRWLHSKENEDRGRRFDCAMRGMTKTEGLQFIPYDYPFNSLPSDTLLVDVGGGIGSLAELVLPFFPHLRYTVQDLQSTIRLAKEIATPAMKTWISEGRLTFQAHDGFVRQPPEHDGAVFVLKNVIHNWPDAKAVQILRTLRQSKPMRLLVIDRMVRPYLKTEAQTEEGEAEIYRPLLHEAKCDSVFTSQSVPTAYDLLMCITHGSKTRLCDEWIRLFSEAGFKVSRIFPLRASTGQAVLEAIPVADA
ncbi:Sterigmatocystin 8-O-methyltransferase [Leucoagaricus sp. SymC.cos]|nr:Sterigmatocystin 8-O-methyltransferase [Leucoagaricus sp. SymC.cos]